MVVCLTNPLVVWDEFWKLQMVLDKLFNSTNSFLLSLIFRELVVIVSMFASTKCLAQILHELFTFKFSRGIALIHFWHETGPEENL